VDEISLGSVPTSEIEALAVGMLAERQIDTVDQDMLDRNRGRTSTFNTRAFAAAKPLWSAALQRRFVTSRSDGARRGRQGLDKANLPAPLAHCRLSDLGGK
jgi:hypothetical protein